MLAGPRCQEATQQDSGDSPSGEGPATCSRVTFLRLSSLGLLQFWETLEDTGLTYCPLDEQSFWGLSHTNFPFQCNCSTAGSLGATQHTDLYHCPELEEASHRCLCVHAAPKQCARQRWWEVTHQCSGACQIFSVPCKLSPRALEDKYRAFPQGYVYLQCWI